ncbi:MAG: response regulator [Vicinamibacterales bacterium]
MSTPTIRIMCVEDHRIVREGLALIINQEPDMKVVGSCATVDEAIELYRTVHPDVTLMDLRLGTASGVDAIKAIRKENPEARIIVLTMYEGDEDIYRAHQAGATTYLLKDTLSSDPVWRRARGACRPASGDAGSPGAPRRTGLDADTHLSRDRGAAVDLAGPAQQGSRRHARHHRRDRADPREEHLREVERERSHGCRAGRGATRLDPHAIAPLRCAVVPGVIYPSSRAQSERTIALARVALAATALLAQWLDPAEPELHASLIFTLYGAYVVYSIGLALLAIRWDGGEWLPLVTHGADIIAFSIFQYLTLGPSSPFFVYFVFSMFCGAVRWGWRGTLITGALVLMAYLGMAVSVGRTATFEGLESNRVVIRLSYLVVATGMLVYLGRYEARLRREIERLARWPVPLASDIEAAVGRVLEYAAQIMQVGCAVVIWEAADEPGIHEARWTAGTLTHRRHGSGTVKLLTDESIGSSTFICTGPARSPQAYLVPEQGGRLRRHTGVPIDASILELLEGDGIASAALATDMVSGRVFFSDLGTPPSEAVPLTEVVVREIASSLDQIHLAQERQQIAAREARVRVARDLHDGVLQGLTGVRLELRAVANSLAASADGTTRDQLVSLERALAMEQRELRYFISGLEPASGQRVDRGSTLAVRLDSVRERLSLEWKTPVTLRVSPNVATMPAPIEDAVPLMVHEAAVNALKHAQPSRVAVDVDAADGRLTIAVTDDGRGFPFKGSYNHDTLTATQVAPRTLLDRVTALGGRLSIESSDRGSRVEMLLRTRNETCADSHRHRRRPRHRAPRTPSPARRRARVPGRGVLRQRSGRARGRTLRQD